MQINKDICKESVFQQVFELYAKNLRDFLIYKFNDKESAEDIVQECFVKLWQNCSEVDFDKVKSYLFTVGNNLFINIKKHEQVVRKHQEKYVMSGKNTISPEFVLIEEEYAKKLELLIGRLPENQQLVFKMSRIEKKKYKEIAEELQISVKTVEKRMSLALAFLRNNLEYFK